jgi:hypothetical protein
LGLNVALNQYDDDALAENLAQIAALGVQHVKQSFTYSPEIMIGHEAERVITAVTAANLTLTPLLDGNPADNFAPPANPNDYAAWAGAFAARFGSDIQHYIIWDEPNLDQPLGQSTRQPRPNTPPCSAPPAPPSAPPTPTPSSWPRPWPPPWKPVRKTWPTTSTSNSLYEEGAGAAFDVAAGKPYGFHTRPQDRTGRPNDTLNFSRLILLREVLERNGDGGKALWGRQLGLEQPARRLVGRSLPLGTNQRPAAGRLDGRRPATRPPGMALGWPALPGKLGTGGGGGGCAVGV